MSDWWPHNASAIWSIDEFHQPVTRSTFIHCEPAPSPQQSKCLCTSTPLNHPISTSVSNSTGITGQNGPASWKDSMTPSGQSAARARMLPSTATREEDNYYVRNPSSAQDWVAQLTSFIARDRISLLLDQDSPFLELCPFAGYGNENSTPSANLIAGIGVVR